MDQCQNISLTEFYMLAFPTSGFATFAKCTGFLLMYLLGVLGNILIFMLVYKVPKLHTPMYFFLSNLSIIDATYVSAILPKLLSISLNESKTISFQGCITQLYFFVFCADAEILILVCMAYDRYIAVCSPLHYLVIMRKSVCVMVAVGTFVVSAFNSLLLTLHTSMLSYCYSHNIEHFFCEIRSLIILASSDTTNTELLLYVEDVCFIFVSFIVILASYVSIIYNVLKIHFPKGRLKTFYSCTSHLISVILFYGPIICLYLKPKPTHSNGEEKMLSLLYVILVPTLNPFVYTLRNKEVTGAIEKILKKYQLKT